MSNLKLCGFPIILYTLEIPSSEKLELRSVLCNELVVMRVTVLNSNTLYPIVMGEEGLMSCSLQGTMARSYKGTLFGGNLECICIFYQRKLNLLCPTYHEWLGDFFMRTGKQILFLNNWQLKTYRHSFTHLTQRTLLYPSTAHACAPHCTERNSNCFLVNN